MTITESQRRTLDLMAESAGWSWADVEALSQQVFREHVAGLTFQQAQGLMADLMPRGAKAVSPMEIEPGVFCELCIRCGEQCTPSPNDALCFKCAKEARDESGIHNCDTEYRADCARCNGVSPIDVGCW